MIRYRWLHPLMKTIFVAHVCGHTSFLFHTGYIDSLWFLRLDGGTWVFYLLALVKYAFANSTSCHNANFIIFLSLSIWFGDQYHWIWLTFYILLNLRWQAFVSDGLLTYCRCFLLMLLLRRKIFNFDWLLTQGSSIIDELWLWRKLLLDHVVLDLILLLLALLINNLVINDILIVVFLYRELVNDALLLLFFDSDFVPYR